MFIVKASGAPLYFCYRKTLITRSRGISGAPAGWNFFDDSGNRRRVQRVAWKVFPE